MTGGSVEQSIINFGTLLSCCQISISSRTFFLPAPFFSPFFFITRFTAQGIRVRYMIWTANSLKMVITLVQRLKVPGKTVLRPSPSTTSSQNFIVPNIQLPARLLLTSSIFCFFFKQFFILISHYYICFNVTFVNFLLPLLELRDHFLLEAVLLPESVFFCFACTFYVRLFSGFL